MIHVHTHPAAHVAFDLLAWASGAGLSVLLYRWRLKAATEHVARIVDGWYFAGLAGGAIVGAWAAGSLNTLQGAAPALSHSIVGALAGAIVGVEIYKRVRGLTGSTGVIFVGAFSLGAVVGRWGCLFAGLADRTYGAPTTLPWAVDLGDGIGRHPVQVYESLAMALFLAAFLAGLAVRAPWATKRGFYAMCIAYAVQRFAWEFLKPYPTVLGPLNLFHLIAIALALYGCAFYAADLRRDRPDA